MNIKQAIPVILVGASMLISMAANSPHILHRTKAMSESVAGYVGHGEMIDSGVRLEFWRAGITIFAESPIIGRGLGSYAEAYSALEGRPKWLVENRSQPHSEFVLQAVQGGGVALLIFCWIIFNIINTGFRNSYADPAILGATALYFIDASFNSVIWDLAEGHILIVFVCASVFQKMRSKVHRNF
jgi:O-antigen ligase